MKRIYIIGSMSQIEGIRALAKELKNKKNEVRVPNPVNISLQDCVNECFKNIQWCDELIVVRKLDATIGESVIHEICFAKFLHKQISFINMSR